MKAALVREPGGPDTLAICFHDVVTRDGTLETGDAATAHEAVERGQMLGRVVLRPAA